MDASKIPIACDKCGKKFGVDAAYAGRAVKCPCGNILKVVAKVPAAQATTSGKGTVSPTSAKVPQAASSKPATSPKPATRPQAQVAPPQAQAVAIQNNLLDQLTAADYTRQAVNPYSPPSSASTSDAEALRKFGAADNHKHDVVKAASGNITFLAVLNFIGAAMYIGAGILLLVLTSILGTIADVLPVAALGALAAGVLSFFGIFDLISGIGLIQRTKWGWWLCVVGLSWAVFDRGFGVAVRFMYAADWTNEIPKAIGGVVFMLSSIYFLQFMCQKQTMKMFKLKVHPGLIWGIAISLGLLLGGIGFGAAIYGMQQVAAAG